MAPTSNCVDGGRPAKNCSCRDTCRYALTHRRLAGKRKEEKKKKKKKKKKRKKEEEKKKKKKQKKRKMRSLTCIHAEARCFFQPSTFSF